jgi:hypothetical protein
MMRHGAVSLAYGQLVVAAQFGKFPKKLTVAFYIVPLNQASDRPSSVAGAT